MLARSTTIKHPTGHFFETPLLIPSFSSKGFGVDKRGKSEVRTILKTAEQYLTDTMLLSAYDIYHGHLSLPKYIPTELAIVDSGGYETSDLQDLSATFIQKVTPADWDQEKLYSILDKWPAHIPAIFVTFDRADKPLQLHAQIARGRELISRYPKQLHTLLVKPETQKQQYLQVDKLVSLLSDVAGFAVLGVTEKELGNSPLERMKAIAKLRLALDDSGMASMPIHVFGSLDPVSVCLYFLAGAEIFDGLTWLRYAYAKDLAVYRQNGAVLAEGLDRRDAFITLSTMQKNLSYLGTLTNRLRKYLNQGDFSHFGDHAELMRQAHELLQTRVKRKI